ncbi:checkpoint protein kinase [Stemphylium lycopersici]|nr:checkpoint protein kinase [Stemphylium lycopersici]
MSSITEQKTMRAMQYDARDNKLHLNEVPIPEPREHEVLVKMESASLCHTDVMLFETNEQGLILGKNPVTIGHEGTGRVAATGSGEVAKNFKQGDPVGFICAVDCCFECYACKNVHNAWCSTGQTKIQGFSADGYFAEYAVVDAREAIILPENLDPKKSAPLFCAGVTAYHGIADCELPAGSWVAVIGCGGLGHMGIQYSKAMGHKVIAIDITDAAMDEAKNCGADYTFNSMTEKDYKKKIVELTGGGVLAAVNFTASKKSYDDCPAIVKPGQGMIMVVGIPQQPLEFNGLDIALGRYRVKGASNGTCYNMREAIEFSAKHKIMPHMTAFPLEEVPKMVELMTSHKAQGRMGVDANSATRLEFEKELMAIDDSDDPLDVYDRYVKWTLDAYPSAQNTPQSQLCPLLERATKAFQNSPQYKNDARYLKLWLHYINLFSDAPREIFAYLARHNIGENLALYYEEFAAWLESAGRFTQAEEVYNMGIERGARPTERLIRKYGEFQHRFESRPQEVPEPTSPALPAVRPALAAKMDPFAAASPSTPAPQAQPQPKPAGGASRSGKAKLAIFSDGDDSARPASTGGGGEGWDSIGSLADRKKENTPEARPWAGETLKVGKKNTGVPKMSIFKDETKSNLNDENANPHPLREYQQAVNPRTGRVEVVFVDLEKVYPNHEDPMSEEYSFEELRAKHRGWMDHDWAAIRRREQEQQQEQARRAAEAAAAAKQPKPKPMPLAPRQEPEQPAKPKTVPLKGSVDDDMGNDENAPPSQVDVEKARAAKKARREERANRTRKIKVMETKEIRGETQTIQTNLDSPAKPKIRRKKAGPEMTMTLHTKEAMDEIYGIFNEPLKNADENVSEVQSGEESSEDDDEEEEEEEEEEEDDYTSGAESTGTGRISCATSEFGDETTAGDFTLGTRVLDPDNEDESDGSEGTEGSEGSDKSDKSDESDADYTDVKSASAWSDFTENKPRAKDNEQDGFDNESEHSGQSQDDSFDEVSHPDVESEQQRDEQVVTPTSPSAPASLPTRFVPVPPEDYNPAMRPYRDPVVVANNRLPFMTPIVEKTESSLGIATAVAQKDYFTAKTPSRSKGTPAILEDDDETCSSAFSDILDQVIDGPGKVAKLALTEPKPLPMEALDEPQRRPLAAKEPPAAVIKPNGPIIKDNQCNPVDESIRRTILQEIQPPLDSYDGYYADTEESYGKGADIRKYTKAVSKLNKNANEKTTTNLAPCPTLQFPGTDRTYAVKRELGKGAFAPVYLVESKGAESDQDENKVSQMGKGEFGVKRQALEAIKMEDPPTPWEFYMMRQAKRRLGVSRAADSIVSAYEMHVFKDECYLVEEYRDQGTLLDLVNLARADSGVMDEQLAMFFTVELFRTVEALHSKGVIHGDLKSDNILVRFDALQKDAHWDSEYKRDGRDGWSAKGVSLIDFGRGIDMKAFKPDVQFIADWPTTEADCAEMRELRPWTYQIDYHGLAGIVHNLLFGKYISTVAGGGATLGAGATKTYKIKESLKRYWQTEIWHECLDLLLNPLMHLEVEEGRKLPVLKGMKEVREKMEEYLENNCEKGQPYTPPHLAARRLARSLARPQHPPDTDAIMSGELATILLSFDPNSPDVEKRRDYDSKARSFVSQLSNMPASQWLKGADTEQDPLVVLNPAENSIAYAFVLRNRIAALIEKKSLPETLQPGGTLWNQLVVFLEAADSVQLRYVGKEWKNLVEYTEQIARACGSPSLAIAPIRSAMTRLDPTTGTFTTIHIIFIQLCLETRSYAAAEPILDNYIHTLPPKIPNVVREGLEYSVPCADVASSGEYIHQNSGHTDRVGLADIQEYYILGAMAYMGIRQFAKAQHFLEHVLVVPSANTANGLMLEAYKKWVLVSCLVEGRMGTVPRTANPNAIKNVKAASKAYEALADAYGELGNMSKLKAQTKAGAEIWAEDGNTGLVTELISSQTKTYVSRLSRTYSAIPVSNIAAHLGATTDEIAQYIDTLIKDGQLNACLQETDKSNAGVVLRFYLDPTQGPLAKSEKQQQQALFQQTLRTNMLAEQVKDADYRMTLTKEYIENQKRLNKRQGNNSDAMDTAWDDSIDPEEDIMGDLH